MNTEPRVLSTDFQRLYCDADVFDSFSAWHPISFRRVLPFQAQDPVIDDPRLLAAEVSHLNSPSDITRRSVMEAFRQSGLLSEEDAAKLLPAVDYFGADFFELMGEVYESAGMFICALRWYREFITELETQKPNPNSVPDTGSVYASVGYCLYSLGLFEEAIAWSKPCIGPFQMVDTVCRELINYEAQLQGGCVRVVERATNRVRYTASAFDPAQAQQITPRLKLAMSAFAPFQESHVDWISSKRSTPEIASEGYPFQIERESGSLTRHRMNLLFATGGSCGCADCLRPPGRSEAAVAGSRHAGTGRGIHSGTDSDAGVRKMRLKVECQQR